MIGGAPPLALQGPCITRPVHRKNRSALFFVLSSVYSRRHYALASPTMVSSMRQCHGLTRSPGKSQRETQEDQGTLKELGGTKLLHLALWSSWPSFWLFLGLPDNPSNWLKLKPAFNLNKASKKNPLKDQPRSGRYSGLIRAFL